MDPITLQSNTIFLLFQSLLMSPVGPYLSKLTKINVNFTLVSHRLLVLIKLKNIKNQNNKKLTKYKELKKNV